MFICRYVMIINNQFIVIKGMMRFFNVLNISVRFFVDLDFFVGKEIVLWQY